MKQRLTFRNDIWTCTEPSQWQDVLDPILAECGGNVLHASLLMARFVHGAHHVHQAAQHISGYDPPQLWLSDPGATVLFSGKFIAIYHHHLHVIQVNTRALAESSQKDMSASYPYWHMSWAPITPGNDWAATGVEEADHGVEFAKNPTYKPRPPLLYPIMLPGVPCHMNTAVERKALAYHAYFDHEYHALLSVERYATAMLYPEVELVGLRRYIREVEHVREQISLPTPATDPTNQLFVGLTPIPSNPRTEISPATSTPLPNSRLEQILGHSLASPRQRQQNEIGRGSQEGHLR